MGGSGAEPPMCIYKATALGEIYRSAGASTKSGGAPPELELVLKLILFNADLLASRSYRFVDLVKLFVIMCSI